jgi:hypothetical protein
MEPDLHPTVMNGKEHTLADEMVKSVIASCRTPGRTPPG